MYWLFDTSGFFPRKDCGDWPEWLVIVAIVSNILIVLAYYAIAITLYVFYHKRAKDFPKLWIVILFVVFIFFCGTIHIFDALMYVWPAYRLLIFVEILTAVISVYTAITLPKIVSFMLKQQSMEKLMVLNKQLEEEIKTRIDMEIEVKELNHTLANEVQRLQNLVAVQGWIAEKQMDLDNLKKVVVDLRKQYARPN